MRDQQNNDQINEQANNPLRHKRKLIEIEDEEQADEILCLKFMRNLFPQNEQLPKSIMFKFATGNKKKLTYRTVESNKRFYCVCEYDDTKYLNSYL